MSRKARKRVNAAMRERLKAAKQRQHRAPRVPEPIGQTSADTADLARAASDISRWVAQQQAQSRRRSILETMLLAAITA